MVRAIQAIIMLMALVLKPGLMVLLTPGMPMVQVVKPIQMVLPVPGMLTAVVVGMTGKATLVTGMLMVLVPGPHQTAVRDIIIPMAPGARLIQMVPANTGTVRAM